MEEEEEGIYRNKCALNGYNLQIRNCNFYVLEIIIFTVRADRNLVG
jgi:hypothetical protein